MGFEKHDLRRNEFMLTGSFARKGYDWWWHSFTAEDAETGEERAFFIDYFVCNPAIGGAEPVFGQLPENKAAGKRPSYLMVKAGCWGENAKQLHRFFGWNDVTVRKGVPFHVAAGDCSVSESELRGSIKLTETEARQHPEYMCDYGEMSWNLKVHKKICFNVGYGACGLFRAVKAYEMFWHAEGMKSTYSGTITLDGRVYNVIPDKSYGYADKNWGRGFTSPWVWLSSNDLVSNLSGKRLENSAFDIGGGRPKIYFIPLERKLLGALWYEGEGFEFNFSKFWTGSKTRFSSEETDREILWHVRQETRKAVMETEIRCNKSEMIHVNYEAPDGTKRHNRLWNGGTGHGNVKLYRKTKNGLELIDDIAVGKVGCEYGEYDEETK